MTSALRLYGKLLRPWLTVAVYLWVLQLIADFAINDPEPLLDRLADCGAILWTLIFWLALAVLVLWLIAPVAGGALLVDLSRRSAKVVLVSITALAFVRWLFNWASLLGNPDIVPLALGLLCLGLGIWVWRRRKGPGGQELSLPSLEESWSFFALPVLTVTAVLLAITVGKHVMILETNRMEHSAIESRSPKGKSQRHPNVILIVADALRAQSMSLYGYRRKTTPFLERFADRSGVYTQMYTNSTSTRTSLTSILSGKNPFSHGRLTKFLPPYDKPENLLRLLRKHGYTNAAITSNSDATFYLLGLTHELVYGDYPNFRRLTLSWLRDNGVYPTSPGSRMYDELTQFLPFLGFPGKTLGYGPADDTFKVASDFLAKMPEPFFLFIHVHEPHNPYETPPPFRNKYAKLTYDEVESKISSDYYSRYKPELQPYVDAHRDHYDEAIEYLDFELERFVQRLKQSPKTSNSLLIITGDHGESFERGFLNHGEDLYESSIHVPLIIHFPGQTTGYRSSEPVQSIDISPTILHAAGIAVPNWADGSALDGHENLLDRVRVVTNYKDPVGHKIYDLPTKLAIRRNGLKLIVSCAAARAELYDIDQNPSESKDLSTRQTAAVKELWGDVKHYLDSQRSDRKMACGFHPGA